MRFLAGLYLIVFGFVWVWQLKSSSPGAVFFDSLLLAQIFGYVSFFFGMFSISPKLWSWREGKEGTVMAAINHLLRGSWYGAGGVMSLMGLGLIGAAVLLMSVAGAATSALMIFTGIVYAIGGISLIRTPMTYQNQQNISRRNNDPTNLVLRIARGHRGRVTPTEIATESTLTVHDAKNILDGLAADGFCEERVSEAGSSFYYFAEFSGEFAKRDIMESQPTSFDHDTAFDFGANASNQAAQHQHHHHASQKKH